jgi:hypothetical protein
VGPAKKYSRIDYHDAEGPSNLYDPNYTIVHNAKASQDDLGGGAAAEFSVSITLSKALISAAF